MQQVRGFPPLKLRRPQWVRRRLVAASVLFVALTSVSALAVQPDELLADPQLEARARTIGKELRCPVCQNQSIDDSDADLARDLRGVVRKRLVAGDNDAQVKQYLVDRYGDYVLLNPPFKATTLVLWLGPLALFLGAGGAAFAFYRRRASETAAAPLPTPLTDAEKTRLAGLMGDDAGDKA